MIAFYKLWDKMNRENITQKELKDKKILSSATIAKMRRNETVNTDSIDKICAYLNCQPGDIMEFEPDNTTADNKEQ